MDNNQTQMAELFEEGGIADDGMRVDPVSGNEIPPGSMASEVRDDVPAQLSEGEYVVPADVLRFYGVKFFEDLRSEAKQGMMKMEVDGRIGGEPVAAEGQQDMDALTPEEMAVLQEMGMAEGGMVPQQRVGYNEAGLEDGTNATTMAANVATQYGRGSGIDRARGVAPATTAAVRMVMLYSPDGLTSQAFTLPAQQVEHDAKIAEGWSATQVGVTTQTSVGKDNENDNDFTPPVDYYSTQKTDSLEEQLKNLKTGKGLSSFVNNFLDKGILGKVLEGVTGKSVMERSINSLEGELKKRRYEMAQNSSTSKDLIKNLEEKYQKETAAETAAILSGGGSSGDDSDDGPAVITGGGKTPTGGGSTGDKYVFEEDTTDYDATDDDIFDDIDAEFEAAASNPAPASKGGGGKAEGGFISKRSKKKKNK